MKVTLKESTIVKPAEATPNTTIRLTILDLLYLRTNFVSCCFFYSSNNGTINDDFFNATLLKTSLAQALVHFYPIAGRVRLDDRGRIKEFDCNGEGAVFVVAETEDVSMEDIDYEHSPIPEELFPVVDRSGDLSVCPLLLVQVTRFKCGGVSLGTMMLHHLADGPSGLHFFNTWSDIARGVGVSVPPFLDRRSALFARDPPQPKFPHIEYQPPPKLNIPQPNYDDTDLVRKRLELTQDQVNALKTKCAEEETQYSTWEVLVGHAWRCFSMAYQLPDDQETKLHMAIDGRSRLQPPLPNGYLGNVIFYACHQMSASNLSQNPLKATVRKIREAIRRMDDEYLRSAIDYLAVQPDFSVPSDNVYTYKCPNIGIVTWTGLPFYATDFGWGAPVHVGRAGKQPIGNTTVSRTNEGSLIYSTTLPKDVMDRFEKLFYDI